MAKKFAVLAASVALLIPLSASAALTRTQAESLVNVVKASPTTATSVFTPLITSFSSITTAQAESLINVIKASPTTTSTPFVDMLLAFTGETTPPAQPSLSYSMFVKAGFDGDTWTEGLNIDGIALVIKNSSALTQQITFPTNCWYTYRIYNKSTGAQVFNLASQQHCLAPGASPATTFTLAPGESKQIDFAHYDSYYHLAPGSYYMKVDVLSTYPLTNAATLNFNVAAKAGSPTCSAYATPRFAYPGQQFKLNWSSTGMSYTSPYNQTGPTLRYTNHYGTGGVILYGASGSQYYSTDKVETVTFALGLGGFSSSQPFIQYCSLNVPIVSDGANGAAVITSGNTTAPNRAFSVAGSYSKNGNLLSVVLVPASYAGSRSYSSASAVGGAVTAQTWANYGVWSATFNGLNEAQYTILIYDTSTATPTLLTSGSLQVTAKG